MSKEEPLILTFNGSSDSMLAFYGCYREKKLAINTPRHHVTTSPRHHVTKSPRHGIHHTQYTQYIHTARPHLFFLGHSTALEKRVCCRQCSAWNSLSCVVNDPIRTATQAPVPLLTAAFSCRDRGSPLDCRYTTTHSAWERLTVWVRPSWLTSGRRSAPSCSTAASSRNGVSGLHMTGVTRAKKKGLSRARRGT